MLTDEICQVICNSPVLTKPIMFAAFLFRVTCVPEHFMGTIWVRNIKKIGWNHSVPTDFDSQSDAFELAAGPASGKPAADKTALRAQTAAGSSGKR